MLYYLHSLLSKEGLKFLRIHFNQVYLSISQLVVTDLQRKNAVAKLKVKNQTRNKTVPSECPRPA